MNVKFKLIEGHFLDVVKTSLGKVLLIFVDRKKAALADLKVNALNMKIFS